MVKVLPKSANTLSAVSNHLGYIGRRGELDLETENGERLRDTRVGRDLVEDWDLDLDEDRRKSELTGTRGREPARLVHKVIFSMPAGTPPEKVLMAVKNFAREEFALKHRYVMALHTDTPRPHVHVVIKAVSEQGQRLHIRKATLREWRSGFARQLQDLGVAANATPRFFRGGTGLRKPDSIYRASLRGESTHMRMRAESVARELARGNPSGEHGTSRLRETRKEIERGWRTTSNVLLSQGHSELAAEVRRFLEQMPPPRSEQELIAAELIRHGVAPPTKKPSIGR
jgi:type IV secretory pathway VirD2 relaxase